MKKSGTAQQESKTSGTETGRPRDARATQAILSAALSLGMEHGFDGLTVEGIAARAGVGKTTIYRRWPDVWSVVVEAVMAEITQIAPVLQRTTARESFTVSMKLVAKAFRGKTGKLLRPLIGRAQFDDGLRSVISEQWLLERRKSSRAILRRAVDNGELRADLDPDIALDALYGPLYHRLLLPYDGTDVRLSDAYVESLIDTVFGGLARKDKK